MIQEAEKVLFDRKNREKNSKIKFRDFVLNHFYSIPTKSLQLFRAQKHVFSTLQTTFRCVEKLVILICRFFFENFHHFFSSSLFGPLSKIEIDLCTEK